MKDANYKCYVDASILSCNSCKFCMYPDSEECCECLKGKCAYATGDESDCDNCYWEFEGDYLNFK